MYKNSKILVLFDLYNEKGKRKRKEEKEKKTGKGKKARRNIFKGELVTYLRVGRASYFTCCLGDQNKIQGNLQALFDGENQQGVACHDVDQRRDDIHVEYVVNLFDQFHIIQEELLCKPRVTHNHRTYTFKLLVTQLAHTTTTTLPAHSAATTLNVRTESSGAPP